MTDNRRSKALPRLLAAVTVWIGATVVAAGGAAALTFETLQKFVAIEGVSGQLMQDSDGCGPIAGLTAGSDGKFYGTTQFAGSGGGTVFRRARAARA